jgi:guanosine-3',5'-bis(diphosphate) 3'-pyrophosphohydrolase
MLFLKDRRFMQEIRKRLENFISDPDVLVKIDGFIIILKKYFSFNETAYDQIQEALIFSAQKHQHQTRRNRKTPYIVHPIGVACQLLETGNVRDPEVLIAALLHDTVEDTHTTLDEIRAIFGEQVASFVAEVSDDKSLPKARRKELQIEKAPYKTHGAAQIKLADALCNLIDLTEEPPFNWSQTRKENYCRWAQSVTNSLPKVNLPLKQKVDEAISRFWESHH